MRCTIGSWVLVGLFLAAPGLASAQLNYNESSGDLSTNGGSPTALAFSLGTNTVTGSVNSTSDARDYITFTVPSGQRLSGLRLASWNGGRGFHAIKLGATMADPSGGNQSSLLGGDHLDNVDSGTERLAALSDGQTGGTPAGTGFTPPLGPGTYTYDIQQTSGTSNYSLEFVITAAPSVPSAGAWWSAALAAMLTGAGALYQLRRTRLPRGTA
jgi:hypothetical protein